MKSKAPRPPKKTKLQAAFAKLNPSLTPNPSDRAMYEVNTYRAARKKRAKANSTHG